MRWFVNINGRTTGPVEEEDLTHMVREGLVNSAHVREESGGAWIEIAQSPFGRLLPKHAQSRAPKASMSKVPAAAASAPPVMSVQRRAAGPAVLEPDDLFDHPLHLDGSVPPPGAPAERAASRAAAPSGFSGGGLAGGGLAGTRDMPSIPAPSEPSNLFDRQLLLDEGAPSIHPPKQSRVPEPVAAGPKMSAAQPAGRSAERPAERPAERKASHKPMTAPEPMRQEPPEQSEISTLFKKDDVEHFDFGGAFTPSMAPAPSSSSGQAPMARPTMGPEITVGRYTDFPQDEPAPEPVPKKAKGSGSQRKASDPSLEMDLASLLEGDGSAPPSSNTRPPSEPAPVSTASTAAPAAKMNLRSLLTPKRIGIAVGALVLLAGLKVGGKMFLDHRQHVKEVAARAAAEQKAKADAEAKVAAEAKRRADMWDQNAAAGKAKAPGWQTELAAAAATTNLDEMAKQLVRVVAIRTEVQALVDELQPRVPPEIAAVLAAAAAAQTQLETAQKSRTAVSNAMDWLRQIKESSLTTKLVQIPIEVAKVQEIQKRATTLVADLGDKAPIELSSVLPAATTALGLLQYSQVVLQAMDIARQDLERAQTLVDSRDWIAADKIYQEAQSAIDKVPRNGPRLEDPIPPELDLAAEQALIVNARKRISSAVDAEEHRLELERKQREQEEEIARQAAAYKARCGTAPQVSPFDGQLFGLQAAIEKQSGGSLGPISINHCTDPTMTKNDCWVSTCAVDGKMFGSDFKRKFSFSEREGFKQLK